MKKIKIPEGYKTTEDYYAVLKLNLKVIKANKKMSHLIELYEGEIIAIEALLGIN